VPIEPFKTDSGEKQPSQQQKTEDQLVGMNCSCGETFLVPLSVSGNAAVCPRCNARVRLPEENFVRIICSCGKPFKIPAVLSGRKGICPQCKRQIKIPEKSEETASGTAFSPPLGYVDYKDTLSDNQLDEIGEILLTSKLKPNKASSSDVETPAPEPAPAPDALPKKAEDFYTVIGCSCGKKIIVPVAMLHRQIRCPQCHNPIRLPENNFIRMHCSCGTEFKVPAILAGKYSVCPACKKRLKISENKV
jgi:uncharacterized paraquat-inducible protein A